MDKTDYYQHKYLYLIEQFGGIKDEPKLSINDTNILVAFCPRKIKSSTDHVQYNSIKKFEIDFVLSDSRIYTIAKNGYKYPNSLLATELLPDLYDPNNNKPDFQNDIFSDVFISNNLEKYNAPIYDVIFIPFSSDNSGYYNTSGEGEFFKNNRSSKFGDKSVNIYLDYYRDYISTTTIPDSGSWGKYNTALKAAKTRDETKKIMDDIIKLEETETVNEKRKKQIQLLYEQNNDIYQKDITSIFLEILKIFKLIKIGGCLIIGKCGDIYDDLKNKVNYKNKRFKREGVDNFKAMKYRLAKPFNMQPTLIIFKFVRLNSIRDIDKVLEQYISMSLSIFRQIYKQSLQKTEYNNYKFDFSFNKDCENFELTIKKKNKDIPDIIFPKGIQLDIKNIVPFDYFYEIYKLEKNPEYLDYEFNLQWDCEEEVYFGKIFKKN